MDGKQTPGFAEHLTDEQSAWRIHGESLWRRAHAIANQRPDLDVGDLYHALRSLELPPQNGCAEA